MLYGLVLLFGGAVILTVYRRWVRAEQERRRPSPGPRARTRARPVPPVHRRTELIPVGRRPAASPASRSGRAQPRRRPSPRPQARGR